MGAKRTLPDFGGKGKGNPQARVVGGRGGYACIDTFEGRVCRFGGPPPLGTCRYNHAPDAKPSPKYSPFGDPLKMSGAVPLQAPLHALPAAVIAAAPAPAAASSAASSASMPSSAGAMQAPAMMNQAMMHHMLMAHFANGRGGRGGMMMMF